MAQFLRLPKWIGRGSWGLLLALGGQVLLGSSAAIAAESTQAQSDAWQFQVTPYIWAIGVSGQLNVPGTSLPTAHLQRSFGDILKDLDGAFFMALTARKNRWVLAADYGWSRQSSHSQVLGVDLESGLRLSTGTVALGYAVLDHEDWRLDLMGGVRGWDTRLSQNVSALGLSARVTERWLDPVLAAKLTWRPAERWSVTAYADVGAGTARSTRQFYATGNYHLTSDWSLSFGYRYLAVDYDRKPLRLDVALQGWLLGLSYRF